MLATDFEHFEKGSMFRGYMRSLLGTGVFNADGEEFALLDKVKNNSTNTLPGELWKYASSPCDPGNLLTHKP